MQFVEPFTRLDAHIMEHEALKVRGLSFLDDRYLMLDFSNGPSSLVDGGTYVIDDGEGTPNNVYKLKNQANFQYTVGGQNLPLVGFELWNTQMSTSNYCAGGWGTADLNNLGLDYYLNVIFLVHHTGEAKCSNTQFSLSQTSDGTSLGDDILTLSYNTGIALGNFDSDTATGRYIVVWDGTGATVGTNSRFDVDGSTGNIRIADGAYIGTNSDVDLLQLSSALLTINGALDMNGQIDMQDNDIMNYEDIVSFDSASEFRCAGHASFGNSLINHPLRGYDYSHADKVVDVVENETTASDWNINRQKGAGAFEMFITPPASTTIDRDVLGIIGIASLDLSAGGMTVTNASVMGSDWAGNITVPTGETFNNISVYGGQFWCRGGLTSSDTGKVGSGFGVNFAIEPNYGYFGNLGSINATMTLQTDGIKADNLYFASPTLNMSAASSVGLYTGIKFSTDLADTSSITNDLKFIEINNPSIAGGASIGGDVYGIVIAELSGGIDQYEILLSDAGSIFFRNSNNYIYSDALDGLTINSGNITTSADVTVGDDLFTSTKGITLAGASQYAFNVVGTLTTGAYFGTNDIQFHGGGIAYHDFNVLGASPGDVTHTDGTNKMFFNAGAAYLEVKDGTALASIVLDATKKYILMPSGGTGLRVRTNDAAFVAYAAPLAGMWFKSGAARYSFTETAAGSEVAYISAVTGAAMFGGNVTIGRGEVGKDYVIMVDGNTNDGYITFMETLNYWKFSNDIYLANNNIITDITSGLKIATATNQKLGFFNATPIVQPSAYTQTYSTTDKTLNAYTPDDESVAYTGIDNAQAGNVYAQVVDLNALRVAYENLRALSEDSTQMLNAVIDDLQALGLAA